MLTTLKKVLISPLKLVMVPSGRQERVHVVGAVRAKEQIPVGSILNIVS